MVSQNWGNQKSWPPKGVSFKRVGFSLKDKLEKMNMRELRDYVKKNGLEASDTSRSELIVEIVNEVNKK